MTFRVGMKVVCVDASSAGIEGAGLGAPEHLRVGAVYTIRWVGECPYEPWRYLGPTVRLGEVYRVNEFNPEWNDMPFLARRFRPLIERKTDISILRALLVPGAKIRETA